VIFGLAVSLEICIFLQEEAFAELAEYSSDLEKVVLTYKKNIDLYFSL
jgi:hypothetical protein